MSTERIRGWTWLGAIVISAALGVISENVVSTEGGEGPVGWVNRKAQRIDDKRKAGILDNSKVVANDPGAFH